MFASLINDSISIIRTRLGEKPIQFITRIDGSLPAKLYGDEARLRQILLNLLSNALKYTREGSITLTVYSGVSQDPSLADTISLLFEVADTGIGIKSEDIGRLFGNFEQMDTKINRGIEGTGLGLAISRNLCRLMGGDITVESEYGKGSTFSASIPQKIIDSTPFAFVEEPETKNALVYVEGRNYGESVLYTLDNMGVGCSFVQTREDFIERLEGVDWQFVFTSSNIFDDVQELLQKRKTNAKLILLTAYGKTVRPDIQTLEVPVQPVSVANILNGKTVDTGYHKIENPGVRFTAPDARILIVDDIVTNLNVAEGLMAPYNMKIDCCTSGLEAIRLVETTAYDIVFMDHMMPGMSGIEAAAAIRALDKPYVKDLPMIALTANAVSGMREMFLEKGFNDFFSKPIEIAKLDEIMLKWIPKEKRLKTGKEAVRESFSGESGLSIPGVDVVTGINMTGGTLEGYKKVLTSFCKDAIERLPRLAAVPSESALGEFTTHVHALKSAAATIGIARLSEEAAELEASGKAGDLGTIQAKLPGFYENLNRMAETIRAVLAEKAQGAGNGGGLSLDATDSGIRGFFLELKAALEAKDMESIDRVTGELGHKNLDKNTREALDSVSDLLLLAKFKQALSILDTLLMTGEGNEKK
jgi:CheY-like chemotaxis protein